MVYGWCSEDPNPDKTRCSSQRRRWPPVRATPFYTKLNESLGEAGFDQVVEQFVGFVGYNILVDIQAQIELEG